MSFRVATLNVWSLPGPLAMHKPQRMEAIVERVARLDVQVVAFQEVWTEDSRDQLIRGTAFLGFEHVWHNRETLGGSGLLVVSKWPIERVRFEAFEARGHAERLDHMDYYSGKGFARLDFEAPGGPVTLLATHLHANYALPGQPDRYRGIRAAQIIQLATSVADVRKPLVVVGDFNLDDDEASYQILRGLTGLEDVAETLGSKLSTSITNNPYQPNGHIDKRIDYIFSRDGDTRGLRPVSIAREFVEPLEIDGSAGAYSDHCGLVAEFVEDAAPRPRATPDPSVLSLAANLIEEGRQISQRRQGRQRTKAASALVVGLAAFEGVRRTGTSRRRFLRNGLGFASGLSFAMLGENLGLSEWIHPLEIEAYADAERRLREFAATLRRT